MSNFKTGQKVLYIPNHANGDIHHPDNKRGVVSSIDNHKTHRVRQKVWVKYKGPTGERTPPENLILAPVKAKTTLFIEAHCPNCETCVDITLSAMAFVNDKHQDDRTMMHIPCPFCMDKFIVGQIFLKL